jgi:hypothetical protein
LLNSFIKGDGDASKHGGDASKHGGDASEHDGDASEHGGGAFGGHDGGIDLDLDLVTVVQ